MKSDHAATISVLIAAAIFFGMVWYYAEAYKTCTAKDGKLAIGLLEVICIDKRAIK